MTTRSTARKPKVLIVTGVLWIGGGAEKTAASLGNYLTDQGYETHLLTFYEAQHTYPYHGIYHSFNQDAQPNWRHKIFKLPIFIWKINRYARQQKIDVVYAFLEEASFCVLIAKKLFFWRRHVIVSVRNNPDHLGRLFQVVSRLLYPQADRVVAVTKAIEHTLQTKWQLTNTITIYNSLDTEYVERQVGLPLPKAYHWLTNASPLVISIGRHDPTKRAVATLSEHLAK
jgi:hypothetical protein